MALFFPDMVDKLFTESGQTCLKRGGNIPQELVLEACREDSQTLGNRIKISFYFVFRSVIRNFAAKKR